MIEEISDRDYPTIAKWWEAHGLAAIEREDLASGEGFVFLDEAGPAAVVFLFQTGRIGFIEGLVSRPGLSVSKARAYCDKLHEYCREIASSMQLRKLIAFVQTKGMVRECQRVGFQQVGSPMAQMVQMI